MDQSSYLISLGIYMRQKDDKQIERLQREYARDLSTEDFVQFMDRKIEESGFSRSVIAQRAGLSRDYCFKVLRGDKKLTERDYLLALCLAMKLSLYDTQKALSLYPFPLLDGSDLRSAIIMAAVSNSFSMDDLNEILEQRGYELLKTSPDMPSAKIRPLRSTLSEENGLYSFTERGQEPLERKGEKTMKSEIRVEWEQMGYMPCDMGITAELKTDEFGKTVYVILSYTPEGDFYTVSKVSYFDEEAFMNADPIEQYEEFHDAVKSDYYKDFIELEKHLDIAVAERDRK